MRVASRLRHDVVRAQHGATLVELLLVLVLSVAVIGPLTAWAVLAVRQHPEVESGNIRTAEASLLSTYLPKDIAVAGSAAADVGDVPLDAAFTFADCLHGEGQSSDVKLVLVRGGSAQLTKIVYTEVAVDAGDGTARAQLWRRTCNADNGLDTAAVLVMSSIVPGAVATCADADGVDCRQVELRARPVGANADVVIRGVRRVDAASLSYLATGNRSPNARITSQRLNDNRPYQVLFSAATSNDPDGVIVCFQWVFTTVAEGRGNPSPEYVTIEVPDPEADPTDVPCPDRELPPGVEETASPTVDQQRQLSTSGVYFVELTVTDDQGVSATTYLRFEIEPRDPIAESRISADPEGVATAGLTLFTFEAEWTEDGAPAGSRHPDGTITQYEWTLRGRDGLYFRTVRTTPAPWSLALPDEFVPIGGQAAGSVRLRVRDAEGRSATFDDGVTLVEQDPPTIIDSGTWELGAHAGVTGLRLGSPPLDPAGAVVRWDPAAAADRYVVEFDGGCGATILRVFEPGPAPRAPLLPSWCGEGSTVQTRVAVELDGQLSAWSAPLVSPAAAHRIGEPPEDEP